MAAPRIPFTVIGGFLGAGKTTLLNRLLQNASPRRLAVLVNDFGSINLDAAAIAAVHGDTIALTNGCVCCSIGDDLSRALIRVIEAHPPFDGIIIEASGVSDPWRIAQLGMAAPELRLDAVVVVADAAALRAQAADPLLADGLRQQLRRADWVLLNKAELLDAQALEDLQSWVSQLSEGRPCVAASYGAVPQDLLTGTAWPPFERPAQTDGSGFLASQFETWSHRPGGSFPLAAWRAWLAQVPAGLLRLKGWVQTSDGGWYELQVAGLRSSWQPLHSAPAPSSTLVAIGLRGRLPRPWLVQMPGGPGH
ncbi:MAG: GTP-binding protein [Burkholderiales bacterium]|nr:GTP-binding protein [Burkholderiales bacterium]